MLASKPLPTENRFTILDLPRLFVSGLCGTAAHLDVNYRLRLRQDDGECEPWTFSVCKGACGLTPGEELDAAVVLTCDIATLGELISGAADLPALYAQRRLAIKGNIDLALKFPRFFVENPFR